MSDLHNKQGEQWPKVLEVCLRCGKFGTRLERTRDCTVREEDAVLTAEHGPIQTLPVVPQSKLEEVRAELREERESHGQTHELFANEERRAEQHEQRAVSAEEVANRLQAILSALTQQEAVEAVAKELWARAEEDDPSKDIGRVGVEGPRFVPLLWEEAAGSDQAEYRRKAEAALQAALETARARVTKIEDYCGCGHPQADHGGVMEDQQCQSCDCDGFEYDQLVTDAALETAKEQVEARG